MFSHSPRLIAAVPLAGVACWALLAGARLGLRIEDVTMTAPGPGLWPILAGTGLLICALALCVPPARNVRHASPPPLSHCTGEEGTRRALRNSLIGLGLACILWICLTPLLGCTVSTAAALYLSARAAGNSRKASALLAIVLPGLLYFCIVRGLRWPLPEGLLFRGGL